MNTKIKDISNLECFLIMWQVLCFIGLPAALTEWLFNDYIFGAIFGVAWMVQCGLISMMQMIQQMNEVQSHTESE